jgi:hypothetical protein
MILCLFYNIFQMGLKLSIQAPVIVVTMKKNSDSSDANDHYDGAVR